MSPLSVRFKTAASISIITTLLLTRWTKLCRKNWRRIPLSSQPLLMHSRTWNNRCLADNCRGVNDARTMSTTTTDRRAPFLSRAGRWFAELVLVFVGVYAAFWLNNYQQHQQDAERRDRILASIEQTLREGIESGKVNRAKEEREAAEFRRGMRVRCRSCIRLFSLPTTVRAISPRCCNPVASSCSTWRHSPRCATTNRLSAGD